MSKRFIIQLIGLLVLLCSSSITRAAVANESKYDDFINSASDKYDVPKSLIKAVIKQESRFRDDIADGTVTSSAGALGLMQLMPGTARDMGFTPDDMTDPEKNIEAGTKYLRFLMDRNYIGDDINLILAAYNAGPGTVQRHGGVPPYEETVSYVRNASRYYEDYAGLPHVESYLPQPLTHMPTGTGRGTAAVTALVTPSVATDLVDVLNSFESSLGLSANTLGGLLTSLIGALALIFLTIQVFMFWRDGVYGSKPDKETLFNAFQWTLRTFFIVVILFQIVTI